jgi:hypothetical protein
MIDLIRARRAALAAQMAEAQQQYTAIEEQLRLLGRNLDAMHGGLQELDALIEQTERAEAGHTNGVALAEREA